MNSQSPPRYSDPNGYVLITSIWMLLLCSAMVALVMLQNLNISKEVSVQQKAVDIRDAQESIVETVVADILFRGPRSQFATLPQTASYQFNDIDIKVRVTAESGKIDMNKTRLDLIDRALRGLGVQGSNRESFLSIIEANRKASTTLTSMAEVARIVQSANISEDANICLLKFLTVFSGLNRPQAAQLDKELARALGQPMTNRTAPVPIYEARTIVLEAKDMSSIRTVVRVNGLLNQNYETLDWDRGHFCR